MPVSRRRRQARAVHEQLALTQIDEHWLREVEARDNLFPDVDWNYWK